MNVINEQDKAESRPLIWVAGFGLLALGLIGGDIFAFRVPLFSSVVSPLIFVILVGIGIARRAGLRKLLISLVAGPPAVLLLVAFITPMLGELHDRWILDEIKRWGSDLRQQRNATGAFPDSQKRFLHGYRAVFINNGPTAPSVILVDLFGQKRISYSVANDEFSEKREM